MKTSSMRIPVLATLTAIACAAATLPARAATVTDFVHGRLPDSANVRNGMAMVTSPEPPAEFRERDLSGPRIGLTIAGGDASMDRKLRDKGLGRVVSQFGWHFERQIVPLAGGPMLVTQAIPLFAGVEYGKLIPTVTFAVGVRTRSGYEFGMGPSFTLVNTQGQGNVGLMTAVGKSIAYDGVSIPLNLALVTNPGGSRITLTAGYAIRHASR